MGYDRMECNLIHESIFWQFVKNFVSIVTFDLCITYTYWSLVDARVEKGKHLEKLKMLLWVHVTFLFYKNLSFFTQRFLYIFGCCGPLRGIAPVGELVRGLLGWCGGVTLEGNIIIMACGFYAFSHFTRCFD